jgi:hypothetical protein
MAPTPIAPALLLHPDTPRRQDPSLTRPPVSRHLHHRHYSPTGHVQHHRAASPFSPLRGHGSSPARRVASHSTGLTENPAGRSPRRDFSRATIAGH